MKKVESSSKNAYLHIVRLLGRRDYSRHKIFEKMTERGFAFEHITEALDELTEQGLYKEEYYTRARIRGLMYKHYAPNFIIQKLALEKIQSNEEMIYELMDEVNLTEEDQAFTLARKKVKPTLCELDRENQFKEKTKIIKFIMSKGHNYQLAKKALESTLDDIKNQDF